MQQIARKEGKLAKELADTGILNSDCVTSTEENSYLFKIQKFLVPSSDPSQTGMMFTNICHVTICSQCHVTECPCQSLSHMSACIFQN